MSDSQRSVERFGSRADAYAAARPGYPAALFAFLAAELGMTPGDTAADLGAGTGLFTRHLLDMGLEVVAVEPNDPMRRMADDALSGRAGYRSVDAPAESTGLPGASWDWVVAAQAFHWFDAEAVAREVERLLRPGGRCVLVWNERLVDTTPFLQEYEAFLREWGVDYDAVTASYEHPEAMERVLGRGYESRSFRNAQVLDRAGLEARVLSSSYMPGVHSEAATEMLASLRALFDRHASGGRVRIEYSTNAYWSRPKG